MMDQRYGLGRLKADDPRDHLLRATLLAAAPVVRRNVHYASFFKRYSQIGGTCVGHGTKALTLTAPLITTKRDGPPTPYDLYRWAILNDEWTENDNDGTAMQMGTSVRAGMKALRHYGLLSAYAFAFTIDDFLDGMMVQPLVLGVDWYNHWWQVNDKTGVLPPIGTASIAGGHCVLCDTIDWKRGLAFGPQSWGYAFGKLNKDGSRNGRWGMTLETIEQLLNNGGEAATSVETRPAPVTP
jgi:hypothetical protein